MLAAFEQGVTVRPVRGKYLAMALPAAYAVAGSRDGKKRPTPESVETALDQDLFVVHRPGHLPILAAKNVSVGGGKNIGRTIRAARFRNKRGTLSRRRTVNAIFPMFLLLKSMRLPKRLDFSNIESDGAKGLEDKFIVELAARQVLTTGAFQRLERWPDWTNNSLDLTLGPALAMFDGSESSDGLLEVPNMDMVRLSLSIEIWAQLSSAGQTTAELNRLRALVRRALGTEPTLGGTVVDVRYLGCDDPEPLDLRQGPSSGRLRLSYEVEHLEGSYDPYL
jgi:hypothetical protein